METIDEVNENFNEKKPKNKGLLVGGIIALIIVVSLALVYFLVLTKPEFIFGKAIDKIFEVQSEDYNSIKMGANIKASIDANDTSMQAQLAEVEKYSVKVGAQMDVKAKQEIVELGLEYDNKSVIDAQIYYNNGDMYTYFEGIFDKYIQIDTDEETKQQMNEIFEMASPGKSKDAEKVTKIIRDEIKTQIKELGEFEKNKTTISVGKNEEKVNKWTLILSQKQLYTAISNICTNLAENKDVLELYKDEEFGDNLKKIATSVKEAKQDSIKDVEISLYTKGLLNKLVAVDLEIDSAEEANTIIISFIKENENSYSYKISVKMEAGKVDMVKGKIEIQKEKDSNQEQSGKTIITAEVFQMGDAKIEIDYSAEYDKGIDSIDTSKSINMSNLTQIDLTTIMQNLMTRPLIGELISSQMN